MEFIKAGTIVAPSKKDPEDYCIIIIVTIIIIIILVVFTFDILWALGTTLTLTLNARGIPSMFRIVPVEKCGAAEA